MSKEQSKPTPGPWAIMDGRSSIVRMPEKADIGHGHKYARLIAAAPDMLDTLKFVLNSIEWTEKTDMAYQAIKEAIANAEGSDNVK